MEAWGSDESDHSLRRQRVYQNGQGHSFHFSSSSVHGGDPPILEEVSVWSIVSRLLAAGYQSRHPARRPRLTLDHRRRRRVWGRSHRRWDLREWGHCVFSDGSLLIVFLHSLSVDIGELFSEPLLQLLSLGHHILTGGHQLCVGLKLTLDYQLIGGLQLITGGPQMTNKGRQLLTEDLHIITEDH